MSLKAIALVAVTITLAGCYQSPDSLTKTFYEANVEYSKLTDCFIREADNDRFPSQRLQVLQLKDPPETRVSRLFSSNGIDTYFYHVSFTPHGDATRMEVGLWTTEKKQYDEIIGKYVKTCGFVAVRVN